MTLFINEPENPGIKPEGWSKAINNLPELRPYLGLGSHQQLVNAELISRQKGGAISYSYRDSSLDDLLSLRPELDDIKPTIGEKTIAASEEIKVDGQTVTGV